MSPAEPHRADLHTDGPDGAVGRAHAVQDGAGLDAAGQPLEERVVELHRMMLNYKFGIDEVMTKVNILSDEFRYIREYNPIEHVGSRLKSFESMLAKSTRKGIPFTPDGIREQMFDVAGVRIICSFLSDIYQVRDALLTQRDLTVLDERDYITKPKSNGYKSLHLIVQVPVFLSDRMEDVVVEIQLRSIAMDLWASLEHKIYYKYDRAVPRHLTDSLRLAADVAWSLDTSMERIHGEVRQQAGEAEPRLSTDELLSPREMIARLLRTTDTGDGV